MTRAPRTVGDVGEKWIVENLIVPIAGSPRAGLGVGDDAAELPLSDSKSVLVSSDKIPEDLLALQFGLMSAYEHGRYLAMVNISDIAAMGGVPLGLLATLALPNEFELAYLEDFLRGFAAACEEHECYLIGGDTGWASVPVLSATAVGWIETGTSLTRAGARPGDRVCVTGELGGFGAALRYFAADPKFRTLDTDDELELRKHLTLPSAQVQLGRMLHQTGSCTSCQDITDGLGQTLTELSRASRVRMNIEADRIPIRSVATRVAHALGLDPIDIAFGIGLELQLAVTLSPDAGLIDHLTEIGEVTDGSGLILTESGEVRPVPEGWQHFRRSALQQVRADIARRPA